MASETGICNRALQIVGATRIGSLADNSKSARECTVAYEISRDALLRSHPWGFSIARAQLAADATYAAERAAEVVAGTSTSFWPAYKYVFPINAVRILLPRDSDLDWIIEGRAILTGWGAPLNVRYIQKITDPNTMDPLFREALAGKIAYAICEPITGSNNKQGAAIRAMEAALTEARRVGAMESLAEEAPESSWNLVRD